MTQSARSTIDPQNLQEVLDATHTLGNALQKGQAQYETPPHIANAVAQRLQRMFGSPTYGVIDPQCASGKLLDAFPSLVTTYGFEIDRRFEDDEKMDGIKVRGPRRLTANCVKAAQLWAELYPEARWDCMVANYPFGVKFKHPDHPEGIHAADWTMEFGMRHTRYGAIIGTSADIYRLKEDPRWKPNVVGLGAYEWPDADVTVSVLYYDAKKARAAAHMSPGFKGGNDLTRWDEFCRAYREENRSLPPFNVYLDEQGRIRTYLSTRKRLTKRIPDEMVRRLHKLNLCLPATVCVDKEARVMVDQLVQSGHFLFEPAAQEALAQAAKDAQAAAVPLMPVTEFERVAYCDEMERLTCIKEFWGRDTRDRPFRLLIPGNHYSCSSHQFAFEDAFTREKPHFDEDSGHVEMVTHNITLSGQDRFACVKGERGRHVIFTPRELPKTVSRQHKAAVELPEDRLWEWFERPAVPTIADVAPEKVEEADNYLAAMELIGGFTYMPGQRRYLARMLVKDATYFAAQTGTGKSLMAITAGAVKGAHRCLILCPKGTSVSGAVSPNSQTDDAMSQWLSEIVRFAPHAQVFEIFSHADIERIKAANGGELPHGFYLTYYQAFLLNGATEYATPSLKDNDLRAMCGAKLTNPKFTVDAETVGTEVEGIRCIAKPSMATKYGHEFDMVCLDEAHVLQNMDSLRTQIAIRLTPKYRYAFSATPVPNIATDIFPVWGWLSVPEWYKGGRCNAQMPYRREDLEVFQAHFLSKERDHTAEAMAAAGNKSGKAAKRVKVSPILSQPARLLKLLKPTMAFVSKQMCNPEYEPPEIIDVRVPMGKQQTRLYGFYSDIRHIPKGNCKDNRVRFSRQLSFLRAVCTDPLGSDCNLKAPASVRVNSPFNPKLIAVLELVRDILGAGRQVVIVSARLGFTDRVQSLLLEAGIPYSRIDSSNSSGNHSEEAAAFKQGHTRVMLMGLKCAVGHSFGQCKDLIIGSLEYSPGPFDQAKGRVDRITSKGSRIYCVLHENSIETTMFDTVALKDDASRIILRGQRIPRDFKPVDMNEVLAKSLIEWKAGNHTPVDEADVAARWPQLLNELRKV